MTFTVVVLWLSGMLLGGIGAFVLAWALFADRFRGEHGRRRCRRCWYEMTGVAGLQCPECGFVARDERHLHRTRRSSRQAATGFLLLLAGTGCGWYATGSVLGWRAVMPLGFVVRLSPLIGREATLRAVVPFATAASAPPTPVEEVSAGALRSLEALVIETLTDPGASFRELQAAADTLSWMRTRVERRSEALLAIGRAASSRAVNPIVAHDILRTLLPKEEAESQAINGLLQTGLLDSHGLAEIIVSGGVEERSAALLADLLLANKVPGATFPQLVEAPPAAIQRLLARLRERYFSGDDEIKHRVTRVVFPNWRAVPAGNADFEAMARHQIAEVMRGETFEKWNGENLITWHLAGALSQMAPEVAKLLAIDAARPRIEGIFRTNVAPKQMTPQIVSEALAEAICIGDDAARLAALRIADRRGDCDQAMLAEAAIAAVPFVRDSITLDALCRRVFDLTADGGALLGVEPRIDPDHEHQLEAALVRNLAAPGQIGSVSARWLGMMPRPSDPAVKALQAAAQNAANSTPLRNAARDALLHIRDRANPGIDPLTPLELAAPK
ncbi:MAG: hypothetical protein U0570_10465 [Phycisphaerales bacterium]